MTRRKAKSAPAPSFPEEADAFNAMEAMGSGHELPLSQYVGDVGEVLTLLANLIVPRDKEEQGLKLQFVVRGHRPTNAKDKAPNSKQDAEWEGTLLQVKEAIETGKAVAVGWFLCDAADVLNRLSGILAGHTDSEDWRLKFHRKGPGKPSDPSKFWRDRAIVRELEFETLRLGKQEAAIAQITADRGISRSEILKLKKKFSTSSRKSPK